MLRCTEPDCGRVRYLASQLAVGSACEECGGDTVVVGVDDDAPPAEIARPPEAERRHPGHARHLARQIVQQYEFFKPPVVPHTIARKNGLIVTPSSQLGSLRARLIGDEIHVNADEPAVAQRFSVAHELGHYFLGTRHGAGDTAEREADAFAGELLVPGPMLRAALEESTDAVQLRGIFKVSRDVLEIAARDHRLFDRLT